MASVRHLGLFPTSTFEGACLIKDGSSLEAGPGTYRPIGLSLVAVMALYWRVKSWKFVHTHTEQEVIKSASFENPPASERELVCGFMPEGQFEDQRLITQVMGNFTSKSDKQSSVLFEIFTFIEEEPSIVKKGDLYYPRMHIAWETEGVSIPPNPGDHAKGSNSLKTNEDTQWGEQKFVLLGKEYSIPLYLSTQIDQISGSSYFYRGEISVNEYWEYDPGDGLGPIYDKHTGRKLRAFPN